MTTHDSESEKLLLLARLYANKDEDFGVAYDFRRSRQTLQHALKTTPGPSKYPTGLRRKLVLELATAWLEDPDVHRWRATERALGLMTDHFPQFQPDLDADVLRQFGKIHRRRWDISGQSRDLRRAVYYYQLGYTAPAASDPYVQALNGFHAGLLIVELARLEERAVFSLDRGSDYSSRVPAIADFWDDRHTKDYIGRLDGLGAPQLRATARKMFEGAHGILSELTRQPAGDRWVVHAATAATLFGLRRYNEAITYAASANQFPVPGNHILQGWAQEFVTMARQRGIRPDAAAVEKALDSNQSYLQLVPLTPDDTATAAFALLLDLEEAAQKEGASDDGERPIEKVARELKYRTVGDARHAVITAEQALVFEVVNSLLEGIDRDMVLNAFTGKVGLALSGGGFRASLYHAGVLAALADLNLLPHVQVLSCVSGGSITGTYYYLLVKERLSTTHDGTSDRDPKITNDDYLRLVEELCSGLIKAAGRDLRARLPARPGSNLRLLFDYSPSKRLGDLIDRFVLPNVRSEPNKPREALPFLTNLPIYPLTWDSEQGLSFNDTEFRPRRKNWTRAAKVPVLVMNATALNTGHNWQLTARHMGEPPTAVDPSIDSSPRLRRVYFEEQEPGLKLLELVRKPVVAVGRRLRHPLRSGGESGDQHPGDDEEATTEGLTPQQLEELWQLAKTIPEIDMKTTADAEPLRVGHAVAASAAVPGVFDPLSLDAGDASLTIKLLDGGVVDNQGITGLIEQDCDVLLISDASGQLSPEPRPGGGLLPAVRSNLISLQRIRAAQYEDLKKQRRSQQVRDFMFVHLTKGIRPPMDNSGTRWEDDLKRKFKPSGATDYGVSRRAQLALALMRTDLDSFSELEAHALMTSGYLATKHELRAGIGPFPAKRSTKAGETGDTEFENAAPDEPKDAKPAHAWSFLDVRELIGPAADPANEKLAKNQERALKHLERSDRRFLRWLPGPFATGVQLLVGAMIVVLLAWLVSRRSRLLSVGGMSLIALGSIVASGLVWFAAYRRDNLVSVAGSFSTVVLFVLSIPAMILSWVYLLLRLFFRFRRGRVARWLDPPTAQPSEPPAAPPTERIEQEAAS